MERSKYVIVSIEDNTEIPADPQEEQIPKQARVWLQPGQRQKQNLNRGSLPKKMD